MAWSEAARKAALEARRRRRSIKSDFYYAGGGMTKHMSSSSDPAHRKALARRLQNVRRILRGGTIHPSEVAEINSAARSAELTNIHHRYHPRALKRNNTVF